MKALTICQPYASLIIGWDGMDEEIRKRVENRTWYCKYKGPLLIHAGKSTAWLKSWIGPVPNDMPFGAIVGRVDVVGCAELSYCGFSAGILEKWPWLDGDMHASGPFCIILANPVRFAEPVPYRGQQGFFDVPINLTGDCT